MNMNPKLLIRSYQITDFKRVIELFKHEGEDWRESSTLRDESWGLIRREVRL